MSKKNSRNLTTWKTLIRKLKQFFAPVHKSFNDFNKKYPNVNQTIQLTFIYFFAIIEMAYNYRITIRNVSQLKNEKKKEVLILQRNNNASIISL